MTARRITVFCSSSNRIAPVYLDAATALGDAIAGEGWELVYGGNNLGSMAAVANACRAAGGRVIGVCPQLFVDKGHADPDCHEMIITTDMRSRKAKMEELGDAFITLPGGFGTLEEFSEMLVGSLLKYHTKPVVLLNIAGFYSPLLEMFDKMIEENFAKPTTRASYLIANNVETAMAELRSRLA